MYPARYLFQPWLVQVRLDLVFLRIVATATVLSPALRPATPVPRQHPECWCNMQANAHMKEQAHV
jgi:hypothetical protein